MRTTLQAFATVAAPALLCVLAIRGAYSMVRGEIVAPGLLITTALGAIVCGVWSRTARTRAANLRHSIAAEDMRSRSALRLRDALIGEGREAVVTWDSAGGEPLSFGGGADLLASCLSGAEGDEVSAALLRLQKDGTPFALTTNDTDSESITFRGCIVSGHAALFMRRENSAIPDTTPDSRKLDHTVDGYVHALNQLGLAVAIFDRDRRLMFHNRFYARLWGLTKAFLDGRPSESEILDRLREQRRLPEQTDFAAWKRARLELFKNARPALEELWHVPSGATLRVVARRRPAGGFVYLFEDVSEQFRQKSAYNALIKVQQATLDTLQESVAVFGTDGRLKLYNTAFARQWRLQDRELVNMPHLNAIADACERRFGRDRIWKTISGAVISASPDQYGGSTLAERSDGRTISLALTRLPDGATMATFADLTDQVRLQAALSEQPIVSMLNEA